VGFLIYKKETDTNIDSIKERWSYCIEESIKHDITKKINILNYTAHIKEFIVHRFDVDANQHLNNIRYLQWLIESISDEIIDNYYLYSIDGRFVAEAQYGDTIMSFADRDIDDNSFIHAIKNQKNHKSLCRSKNFMEEKDYNSTNAQQTACKNIWFSGFENDNPFRIMIKKYPQGAWSVLFRFSQSNMNSRECNSPIYCIYLNITERMRF